jgi:hypothetical protein
MKNWPDRAGNLALLDLSPRYVDRFLRRLGSPRGDLAGETTVACTTTADLQAE